MLLTILLLWCSGMFCGEVSKSIKEYSFEKHREEIVKDLREDIQKNLHEICYDGKTIGYYYKGAYGTCYAPVV